MSGSDILHREQRLGRPVEEVFAFFEKAENLERITPPWLNFRIVTPSPIAMAPGVLIDYSLTVRGIPVKWQTRIAEYAPPYRFVDEQVKGPYALWHHTHVFTAEGDETRMVDTVRYRVRFGPLGTVAKRLFVQRDVERIFDYRARVIDELFPAEGHPRRVMAL